ncbi:TonB-dependent receptor [Parabacteroides goldsteinii]|jgi:TonB-linked SusC/RagA family outer membrane protein|uniref:TonB-dependent receptor n=2 Tax=Parabacteroides goldsteinii TaxID=328812 RepID=UPI0022E2EA53|nr:TonB-dependent receptor [Parabacteroides goldsteinii]
MVKIYYFQYKGNISAFILQSKITRIMKLTSLLLFLSIGLAWASNSYAQKAILSMNMTNRTVFDVLEEIETRTDFHFFYNSKMIDIHRTVSVNVKDKSVFTILDQIFKNSNVAYKVVDKDIILSANEASGTLQDRRRITGVVKDKSTGEPVIGVNVLVKGSTNGTVTDIDGRFSLEVSSSDILSVSYIGYMSQEITVSNKEVIDVDLQEDSTSLDEVVVVGFGTQKKVNLTGSVSALSTKDIEKLKVTQTSQLLSGMVSGINVTQGSGQPGGDHSSVTIRGLGTFSSAGNSPLVLVDGLSSSLDNVNANDIESISVLKDAASASIYGTRAANGVILIKTKNGKEGKAHITYQGSFGFSRVADKAKIVDSWTYAELYNEALINSGGSPQYTAEEIAKFKSGEDPDNYPNKRHYDDLISSGNGFQTNQYVGITGGTEKNSYMFSLGYLNQNGIVDETNYKRYNVMFNANSRIRDNFKINVKFAGQRGDRHEPTAVDSAPSDGVEGLIDYSLKIPNTVAGKRSDGYYGNQTGFTVEGWMDSESFIKYSDVNAVASANFEWNILKDLKLTGIAGYDYTSNDFKKFRPTLVIDQYNTASPSDLRVRNTRNSLLTLQAYLNYDLLLKDHLFHFLLGYSQESNKDEWVEAYRDNFPNNALYEINAGSASNQQNSGSASEWALASFFGRINYSFKDRYLLEMSARYDASSRFPKSNRWGFFPSISGGWIVSQEDFFDVPMINNLKLRVSWGTLGNQNIGNYPYQQVLTLGMNVPFGVSEVLWPGAAATVVPSTNITWESTKVANVGFDLALFDNKMTLTADYYNKETSDILYNVTASKILGMTPSVQNAGTVVNKGIDLSIQHRNIIGDFSYSIAGNLSYVKNRVKKLANVERDIDGGLFVGYSLESIYGYVTDGFFNSQEEIDNYAKQPRTAKPGDLKLVDISGPDGVPDGVVNADYDRKIIGDKFPNWNFGLNMNVGYKQVDFLLNMSGVAGMHRLIDGFQANAFYWGSNPQEWMAKGHWTETNHDATYPRMLILGGNEQQLYTSTYRLMNASFLRINDIQIGYTFPSSQIHFLGMSNLRLYASVKNVVTFHNYLEGWDPERRSQYPAVRDFMFGINVTF